MVKQSSVTIRKHEIIKNSTQYLAASLVGQSISLIRTVLLPVLLSPSQLGMWNLINVIISYGANAHVGLLDGMNKVIPFLRGNNKQVQIDQIKDSVFWVNLLLGGFSGVAIWFAFSWILPEVYELCLRIAACILSLQLIFFYYFSLLRADNRFGLLSIGVAGSSVASTILILGGIIAFHDRLHGALIGLLASNGLILVFWMVSSGYRYAIQIRIDAIKMVFRLGFPIIIIGFLNTILISIDRWMIAAWLDEKLLGYYALGFMASSMIAFVPGSVANVLYPRMLESFGRNLDPQSSRNLLLLPMRALAVMMLVIIVTANVFLPMIIQLFLPKYLASIPVLKVMIPGAFFISLMPLATNYLISTNRQNIIITIQVIWIILCLTGNYLVLKTGYSIIGIAVVTMVCFSIQSLTTMSIALTQAEGQKKKAIFFLALIVLMFMVMVVVITIMEWLIPIGNSSGEICIFAFIRLGLQFLLLGYALWLINRNSEMMLIIREEWKRRFGKR